MSPIIREHWIREYDAALAGPDLLAGICAVQQAVIAHDEPDSPIPPYDEVVGVLRHGWGVARHRTLYADVGGVVVGDLRLELPDDANTHAAAIDLAVAPEHRRQGIGTALLGAAARVAGEEGRRLLIGEAGHTGAGAEFARRHGAVEALVEARSVCRLADVDPAVLDAGAARAAGYELVRWRGGCPPALLEAFVRLKRAMADAPVDELDWEPEHWDASKIRKLEDNLVARGVEVHVIAARTGDGDKLAAMTEVYVNRHAPGRSEQGDTIVLRGHRGHGLGLRMKAVMVR